MTDGQPPNSPDAPGRSTPEGIAVGASFAFPPPLHAIPGVVARGAQQQIEPGVSPHASGGLPRPSPIPVPQPRPQPTPVIASAAGFLGPVGRGQNLIEEYYQQCGLETVGAGQITVNGLGRYTTFEGLIDALQSASQPQNVIVNHGSGDDGLLVPMCKETAFNKTGTVIGDLSGLADMAAQGPIDPRNVPTKVLLDGVAQDMNVKQSVVLRLVDKLVKLRQKRLTLHFRACNMDDSVMMAAYKSAFGAQMISSHPCRLLFLPFLLDQMKPGKHVAEFSDANNAAATRLRTFEDPIGLLSPIILAIHDIDGHTHVEQESFIEERSLDQVHGWAEFLVRQWGDPAPARFVVPIMWDNKELTFHCPLEVGWRGKLQFV